MGMILIVITKMNMMKMTTGVTKKMTIGKMMKIGKIILTY